MGSQKNAPLPDGLEINSYRIVRKIASGGFSIVYLAEDRTGTQFAIKEYLPSNLCKRDEGELKPRVEDKHVSTFRNGMTCFFEEGRALAGIFHPNVVRVVNFFRANNTVYMVMAFEKGRSLQEIVLRHRKANARRTDRGSKSDNGKGHNKGRPDPDLPVQEVLAERHVIQVFNKVMNGLREVHANRLLHLDLKPANVYLRMDGTPLLLDFGAARRTLDADSPRLFPMYTPGFAAPELYRRNPRLGPWTDVYGLGTSMYACMAGMPPQPADKRAKEDLLIEAVDRLSGVYSQALLDIIIWCVKLDPAERPQSVFTLQRALRSINLPEEPRRGRIFRFWSAFAARHKTIEQDSDRHSLIASN